MYSRLCFTRDTSQGMSLGKMAHPALQSTSDPCGNCYNLECRSQHSLLMNLQTLRGIKWLAHSHQPELTLH